MTERLSQTELDAWQALLHAHHRITKELDSDLRDAHGLTLSEYDVLLRLARAPKRRLRMTELAERVMFSPSGLTRVVDRLVEAGLVGRGRDSNDARVVYGRLSAKGHRLIRAAAQTHLRGIRRHFTSLLSASQLRSVASALAVITGPHEPH